MRWCRFGVPIAVIVLLFVLGRITNVLVDWAWFSSIGYVGVFWTVFAAKAVLFVVAFAVSTLLFWANASLALRFASRPGVQSATVDQRAEALHRRMARLLRLLPNSASPHEPRSVDPSKIAFVSLAAMANQAKPLRGVTPSRRSKVPGSGRRWFTNRAMAHVRTPGGPTSPTQRLFRDARSSPNLCARPSLTRSNRRGTGPVCPVVWEGWRREASPYPDQS